VYADSDLNSNLIQSFGHDVRFGIDATRLPDYFDFHDNTSNAKFDLIQFNFPHWKGKANNRYNRRLIQEFFEAASGILNPTTGLIRVALMKSQGGMNATTMIDWKQSWMPALYAAESNLLLVSVEPFMVRCCFDLVSFTTYSILGCAQCVRNIELLYREGQTYTSNPELCRSIPLHSMIQ
jgi:Domain of unknown function (DUF2431)